MHYFITRFVNSGLRLNSENATQYFDALWARRFFCLHLALSDIRSRFRRSHLGLAWAILQPLLLTTMMSLVLATVFRQPYKEFSLYVFSGLIAWEFIVGSISSGAGSLIGAEGYLRQMRIPLLIFPIKAAIFCLVFFACGLFGYFLYAASIAPETLSIYCLYVLPVTLLLFLFCLPLAIISAVVNAYFRDYLQVVTLLLQMLWYLSPVFVAREIFHKGALSVWTQFNPIAGVCDLLRAPLLMQAHPSFSDIRLVVCYTVLLWAAALWLLWRHESKLIYCL